VTFGCFPPSLEATSLPHARKVAVYSEGSGKMMRPRYRTNWVTPDTWTTGRSVSQGPRQERRALVSPKASKMPQRYDQSLEALKKVLTVLRAAGALEPFLRRARAGQYRDAAVAHVVAVVERGLGRVPLHVHLPLCGEPRDPYVGHLRPKRVSANKAHAGARGAARGARGGPGRARRRAAPRQGRQQPAAVR